MGQRPEQTSEQRCTDGAQAHGKMLQGRSAGKRTFNEIPLSAGPKLSHGQPQRLARLWSHRNAHLLLVGKRDGAAALQDSLVVNYRQSFGHDCPKRASHRALDMHPEEVQTMTTQKLHMGVNPRLLNPGSTPDALLWVHRPINGGTTGQ